MEQLVEECCSKSNIDTCLRKIRVDSASGPDGQHGYCVRKGGPVVAALVRYLITLILLNGNVEPATSSAYLALVLKARPFDAIKGYRPLGGPTAHRMPATSQETHGEVGNLPKGPRGGPKPPVTASLRPHGLHTHHTGGSMAPGAPLRRAGAR